MQLDPGSQHSALFQVDPHPNGGLWLALAGFGWLHVRSCWVKSCLWSEWSGVGELSCSASLEHLPCGSQRKVLAQKGTADALIFLLYTDTIIFKGRDAGLHPGSSPVSCSGFRRKLMSVPKLVFIMHSFPRRISVL